MKCLIGIDGLLSENTDSLAPCWIKSMMPSTSESPKKPRPMSWTRWRKLSESRFRQFYPLEHKICSDQTLSFDTVFSLMDICLNKYAVRLIMEYQYLAYGFLMEVK